MQPILLLNQQMDQAYMYLAEFNYIERSPQSTVTYQSICQYLYCMGFITLTAGPSELICIVLEISLQCPSFIVLSFICQISILRCIIVCSKKNTEDLINFQNKLVTFMTPLVFAYLGTLSVLRLANDRSLGYVHLVSIFHLIHSGHRLQLNYYVSKMGGQLQLVGS